ncbi:allophanate hydrolase [Limibaculum sp. M0105]|uniref:Allophanate hydrolase n=1 Tax=Thermohalobaculum xanthum TaxID=2753746 RepID=A0A8J7SEV0_9RHOB|nr:allophanate hydrolase [Thermohalobaculum xanthum]MBK0399162.1 allophanate hydrolase [Thermohalobaculum xanthum]
MHDQIFSLDALRSAYAAGRRPDEVVAEVFRRIRAAGDPGIFLHLNDEAAVAAEARALGPYDADRPLWGIPFAVKDNIDVAGLPTTAACPAYAYHPARDAFTVARLREAGALVIGKTNLDQFATGLVGVRTPYPVPRNALDPEIVPGGSSSGSAVAVARGIVCFALGTDTAGSGRVPAALNNIVGLKPTLGAFSATGVVPACRTLDTVSIFALTVADAFEAFCVAAAFDPDDAYGRKVRVSPLAAPPPSIRVGVPDAASLRFFGDKVQEASFRAGLARLEGCGATVVEIDFQPFHAVAEMLYEGAWVAERHTVIGDLIARSPDAVHPVTRAIVGKAESLSAADAFRGFYRLADLRRETEPVLDAIDMLCVPTIPTFYSLADLEADPIGPNSRLGTYTNFVNLLDLCGISVPTMPRDDGRPGSLTLLARAGQDGLIASVATWLEQFGPRTLGATQWPVPAAPDLRAVAQADEVEIAVCGAHMSGMALNTELASLGARFLRCAETAPEYRLYRLSGAPPRPGLVRVKPDAGATVALEVWALPTEAVGRFLAGIPSPLGLGTVRLADGTAPKGFLCEAAAVDGAEDVTALGGWRAVVARDQAAREPARAAGESS